MWRILPKFRPTSWRLALAKINYEKAFNLFQAAGDKSGAASALRAIGRSYNCATCDAASKKIAGEYYGRAIALYEEMPAPSAADRRNLYGALRVVVKIYDSIGDHKLKQKYEKKLNAFRPPE